MTIEDVEAGPILTPVDEEDVVRARRLVSHLAEQELRDLAPFWIAMMDARYRKLAEYRDLILKERT